MQNERIFYMDKAVDLFNSLREEKVSERVDNAHLGAMGTVNVQVWTSVLGGTLQYETSNGGCTLRVIHTETVIEENIQDGWVACSERMPEKADEVLCAKEFDGPGDWRQKVGYYLAGKWTVYSASWTPTHWMPLPAAPRQEV
ncbi:DUF551 domain-containing protein [Enterobacter hormaechei]|nr:DUF551 domain-containing protein [Enterobacter hormaechei]